VSFEPRRLPGRGEDRAPPASGGVDSEDRQKIALAIIPFWNIVPCLMWHIEPTTQWPKDQKWYEKKHPRELAAVLHNLQRYMDQLNAAPNARAVQAGFLHHEPGGVVAIDQKSGGKGLQETRLYTFADARTETVYLITLGDKGSQPTDIKFCSDFVKSLSESQK
jgi:hypothetical protein